MALTTFPRYSKEIQALFTTLQTPVRLIDPDFHTIFKVMAMATVSHDPPYNPPGPPSHQTLEGGFACFFHSFLPMLRFLDSSLKIMEGNLGFGLLRSSSKSLVSCFDSSYS